MIVNSGMNGDVLKYRKGLHFVILKRYGHLCPSQKVSSDSAERQHGKA